MNTRRIIRRSAARPAASILFSIAVLSISCSPRSPEPAATPDASAAPGADAATAAAAPRVFFVDLEDGAKVTSPLALQFGAENFQIEPVGDGAIHHGAGHFHIGLDTECLPAGTVIPTASPWIHFGTGSNTIDMDLAPGPHALVLQVGDGEHRTLAEPGLCSVIHVQAAGPPA